MKPIRSLRCNLSNQEHDRGLQVLNSDPIPASSGNQSRNLAPLRKEDVQGVLDWNALLLYNLCYLYKMETFSTIPMRLGLVLCGSQQVAMLPSTNQPTEPNFNPRAAILSQGSCHSLQSHGCAQKCRVGNAVCDLWLHRAAHTHSV
jgi:hypothetical protein